VNYGKGFVFGVFVVSVMILCGCELGGGSGTFEAEATTNLSGK